VRLPADRKRESGTALADAEQVHRVIIRSSEKVTLLELSRSSM
jgi:hypothetical protein